MNRKLKDVIFINFVLVVGTLVGAWLNHGISNDWGFTALIFLAVNAEIILPTPTSAFNKRLNIALIKAIIISVIMIILKLIFVKQFSAQSWGVIGFAIIIYLIGSFAWANKNQRSNQ